jgi:P4 family phage/plasmid primase-like protien
MSSQSLIEIIESARVEGMHRTHVSLDPCGRYIFGTHNIEKFWDEYCMVVNENEKSFSTIAEMPTRILPVLVDVDIKKKQDIPAIEKLYTEHHLATVIEVYQTVLKNILDNPSDKQLCCFVLEKEPYLDTNDSGVTYLKNGFHLHFPWIFMTNSDHEIHLTPRIKDAIKRTNVFKDIGFDNSAELIDACYIKNAWLMYGSSKGRDKDPYLLSKIVDIQGVEIDIDEALDGYKLYNIDEDEIDITGNEMYYLPRILSTNPCNREISELKQNLICPVKTNLKKLNKQEQEKFYDEQTASENLQKAKKLLKIISSKRADNRSDWMNIGWTLYNIGNGSEEALDLWLEFSKQCSDKFNEAECISHWDRMVSKDKTIGTLCYYAKEDNPSQYKKYTDECMKVTLQKAVGALKCTHVDIASILHVKYGDKFVCANVDRKLWYVYENHHWELMDGGADLIEIIMDEKDGSIIDTLCKQKEEIAKVFGRTEDQGEIASCKKKIENINKMIVQLKTVTFYNGVMNACNVKFRNKHFLKNLANNPYLVGFQNGVYDLRENIFRKGEPGDYVYYQMPFHYKEFNNSDREVAEIHTFMEKMFPDKSLREYFMDISSEIFVGGNHNKKAFFWIGEGNNGKTIMQQLFQYMLGPYAITLGSELLTGKKGKSSDATPDLVRFKYGVRWLVMNEPSPDEVLNIGLLKQLSGNDTLYTRGLYKEGEDIQPMFKMAVISNKPPIIPYNDQATWNRIRVIPFESTFSTDAPDSYEEQLAQKCFKMDKTLGDRLQNMVQAFAWVLLEHRKKGVKMIEPEKVILATDNYRKNNDIYKQFVEEQIDKDRNGSISLKELYTIFKEWYKESVSVSNIPNKNDVKECFIRLWGPLDKQKWKGYKVKLETNDDEDDEINERMLPPV